MRIARIVPVTRVEGPGIRFAVWTQGCSIRCPFCYAVKLQDPAGGREISQEELRARLFSVRNCVEGITLLGGEPSDQAREAADFAGYAKELGLSVLLFSGHTLEELTGSADPDIRRLLSKTDVLIDGPYRAEERDFTRPLAGSSNQRFRFLSDRYTMRSFSGLRTSAELRIAPNGSLLGNGMGDFSELMRILTAAQKKPEEMRGKENVVFGI